MDADFASILQVLSVAEVDFVIVGGLAATVHGSARLTQDVDVVDSRSRPNLERLARSLAPYAPYLRGAPPGLPFALDARTLEQG